MASDKNSVTLAPSTTKKQLITRNHRQQNSSVSSSSKLRQQQQQRQQQQRNYNGNGSGSSSRSKKSVPVGCRTSSNTTKRKRIYCTFWMIVLGGCSLILYSLHHSTGLQVTSLLQQELEKEAQYLSSLFFSSSAATATAASEVTTVKTAASLPRFSNKAVNILAAVAAENGKDVPVGITPMEQQIMEQRFLNAEASLFDAVTRQKELPSTNNGGATNNNNNNNKIDFANLDPDRHHAILIPYRNRKYHLEQFIEHMGPYLQRNFPTDTFELWIVEQGDNFLFNRAWLTNVGIASIKHQNRLYKYQQLLRQQHFKLQQRLAHLGNISTSTKGIPNNNNQNNNGMMPIMVPPPPRCIVLHDVDLIPTVDGVPYTNCSRPMQLGSELAHFNNSIPYPIYTGGVGPTMMLQHWIEINGMSNDFYGWGGEDDELWHRLRLTNLLKKAVPRPTPPPSPGGKPYTGPKFWPPEIERPPKGKGMFRPISEADTVHVQHKSHNQWTRIGHMLELMQNNSARWKKDGLSDLRMTVIGDAMTITHWDSINSSNNHTISDPMVVSTSLATTTTITRKHFVSAKQQGSIISSLSIEPTALAAFAAIHHIKAIPKITALEFLHVTQTDGGRIERAGARAGISWGACHYHHALEVAMRCPDREEPELEGRVRHRRDRGSHTPWQSPLQDFEENPYKGRPTFAVVRNPYDRLIDFFYCPWNGYKGEQAPNATDLNLFLQEAMFPEPPKENITTAKEGEKKTKAPKPVPTAFLYLRPQFHYVFASNQIALYSKPFVTHVLRFETIEEDFENLMRLYNLNDKVRLPAREPSASKHAKTLTPLHFDKKTLDMIHRFYGGDFTRFNYNQIHHKDVHR